jgi:hypothetical protein
MRRGREGFCKMVRRGSGVVVIGRQLLMVDEFC